MPEWRVKVEQKEDEEVLAERCQLAVERIREIGGEDLLQPEFGHYFKRTAEFLLLLEETRQFLKSGKAKQASLKELQKRNKSLYEDILPENYGKSYGNPAFAVEKLGEYGQELSWLYVQMRAGIGAVYEGKTEEYVIRLELFTEVYAAFSYEWHENQKLPKKEEIRETMYWFVSDYADIFAESSHGMMVLSCIGMNQPDVMTGTAPEASFWLLRSEDEYTEHLVEQDYWAAAVEFADSVGADVLNTSLGYYTFDDKSKDYKYRDLDGRHALMSRQASRIADKGMILVCSAGNSGMGSWKKITPPGDADNVLTVGAVNKNALLAPFSSIGNTADNRIKPDVVAVGEGSDVMRTDGTQGKANGTSFSSPIMCGMVTCLWQARPELTAKEVIELVRRSGDRADFPDNIYGYGIPDMWKAYNSNK